MDICTNEITELLNLVKNNSMDLAFVINPENQPLKDFEYKTVERYSLVLFYLLVIHFTMRILSI